MKNKILLILFIVLSCISVNARATPVVENTVAITSQQCADINPQLPFLLVLRQGNSVVDELADCAKNAGITTASVQGIGMVKNVDIAYFDVNKKKYLRKQFNNEDFELLSLLGNITVRSGKPFSHLHVVLGNKNYQTFGGHLFAARAGVTVELFITPIPGRPAIRHIDKTTGAYLISQDK